VAEQVEELERLGRLRRFLSPQLAELVLSSGDETFLQSHRREITVVFCDLRGFTAFSETGEPEDVWEMLRTYHAALGDLIHRFEGTLERFTGDGLMVFFNDPVPCPDAPLRAVRMAVGMRARIGHLAEGWTRMGYDLHFAAGIAQGHATLGQIGFEGRSDYAAIGSVTNLAARLCAAAAPGQVLISQRVHAAVEQSVSADVVGDLDLKGFARPARVFSVRGLDAATERA
jgi:adenylate cyclase